MLTLKLVSAAQTDRGQKRSVNEDTIFDHTGVTDTGEHFGLYIVCDGLGGHEAGDIASQLAVRTVTKELKAIVPPLSANHMSSADINHTIWTAVQRANEEIWYQVENSKTQAGGMGTTLTMALVINNMVHVAHVGDSRLYLLRNGELEQLTQDHTMAAALAEAGHIAEEEVVEHPRQNILTRALGRQKTVEVELMELPLLAGDTLLLCSDGFWKAFGRMETLEERLSNGENTAEMCEELLNEANELDGSDNISLIVVAAFDDNGRLLERSSSQVEAVQMREAVPV